MNDEGGDVNDVTVRTKALSIDIEVHDESLPCIAVDRWKVI